MGKLEGNKESFNQTFGHSIDNNKKRKRRTSPQFSHPFMETYITSGKDSIDKEQNKKDEVKVFSYPLNKRQNLEHIFELINECNVIIEVLDVRDIIHSRIPKEIEFQILGNPEKHLILLLNKIDLVDETFIKRQYNLLKSSLQNIENVSVIQSSNYSRDHLQEMFKSLNNEIGKYRLNICINYDSNNDDCNGYYNFFYNKSRKAKLGVIGYPHVGKESLIHSFKLLSSADCTKQYISFPYKYFEINQIVATCFIESDMNSLFLPRTEKDLNKIKKPLDLLSQIFEYISQEEINNIYKLNSPIVTLEDLISEMALKYKYDLEKERNKIACHLIQDLIEGKLNYTV